MDQDLGPASPHQRESWTPVSQEPKHPLAALDGQPLAGGRLRVRLGRLSRFGARYFDVLLESVDGRMSRDAAMRGLHHSGPLPSYNWIEVAQTNERLALSDGGDIVIGKEGIERLFALLLAILPPGGHLMVEYDSPERAETARALTQGVPPVATPLGALLFRIGFAAHFKDWQIAEGGSEGPRKLQAYKPPSEEHTQRWRRQAAQELQAFLATPAPASEIVQAARERSAALLPLLTSGHHPLR